MKRFTSTLPLLLAAVLQLMPLMRNFLVHPATGSTIAFILRWGIGTGAVLGSVDAVSGASNYFTSPSSFNGTVGTYFTNSLVLKTSGSDGGAFATLTTNGVTTVLTTSGQSTNFAMPPGLIFKFYDAGSAYDAIYGTPNTPGVYVFTVSMSRAGSQSVVTNITITISAPANQPPAITSQPASTNITPSGTAIFRVGTTGTAPLAFRWHKDGNPLSDGGNISGTATNALTISAASTNDNGVYSVTVTNAFGSVTSSNATLAVLMPPAITSQPADITNAIGATASFNVAADGSPVLGYRWFKSGALIANGAKYAGATSGGLTIFNLAASDAANYSVVITNSVGSVTSRLAGLTVQSPPAITTHPVSQALAAGGTATFNIAASGTGPLSYQWYVNSSALTEGGRFIGSTSNRLTIVTLTTNDAGSYFVVVSNQLGNVTSSNASLAVVVPPSIESAPQPQVAIVGSNAVFSVSVAGSAPFAYRWLKNGAALTEGIKYIGVGSNTLTITALTTNDAANYSVAVTNVAGSVTSSVAALTVQAPLAFTVQAGNRAVPLAATTVFQSSVVGTFPVYYQWFKDGLPLTDGGNISGSASNNLSVTITTTNDAGNYWLAASNSVSAITSSNAALAILTLPAIVSQPTNQSAVVANPVFFSVGVEGVPPLRYQWKTVVTKSGKTTIKAIKGATNSVYSIPSATSKNDGGYFVVITNGAGAVTSSIAMLKVFTPITLTKQAASRTVNAGGSTIFNAKFKGTTPIVFQWMKDGLPLVDGGHVSGATSNVLVVSALTTNDSGAYILIASNFAGAVTSAIAPLTVIAPPVIIVHPTNQTVAVSNSVSFGVVVDGTAPFKFQWLKGKTAIKGATNAAYTILNAKLTDAATNYMVTIANAAGSVTSIPATLTVLQSAAIVQAASASIGPATTLGQIYLSVNRDGSITVSFNGVSGTSYSLEAADSLDASAWQTLGSQTAQPDGFWQMTDTAPSGPQQFYRVSQP